MGRFAWLPVLMWMAFCLGLSGCQPQPFSAPRVPPAAANAAQPANSTQVSTLVQPTPLTISLAMTPTGAPGQSQADQRPTGSNGGEVPQPNIAGPGSGVMDNQSQVTGQLISQSPDDTAGVVRLHVKILSSKKVFGPTDFTLKFVSKEIDLFALAAGLPALNPGDRFEAKVWFKPSEKGKEYRVTEMTKQ